MLFGIKKKVEIILLILIGLLFVYRTAMPTLKYIFLVIYIPTIFYFIYRYWATIKKDFSGIVVHYLLAIIVLVFLIYSVVISSKIYLVIFKDLLNVIIIFSFFFIYSISIKNKQELSYFIKTLISISIILAILISIIGLYRLGVPRIETFEDYNFALIPIFIGFCGIAFSKRIKILNLYKGFILNGLLILFTVNIVQSGSRRGLFILVMIICIMIIQQVLNLFKKNIVLINQYKLHRQYLMVLFIFATFIYLFIFQTNYQTKNIIIEKVGFKDVYSVKHNISRAIYRYFFNYKNNLDYKDFHDKIWTHVFDPRNPGSGWGSQMHRVIYPLQGKKNEIVPKNAKGYLLDSTTVSKSWDNNAYSTTFVLKHNVEYGLKYISSVYCYVSDNFNGDDVRIYLRGNIRGNTLKKYNLNKKGEWQKLKVNYKGDDGLAYIFLRFSKYEVHDFSTLKGYVIFAYPMYKIIDVNDSIVFDASKGYSHLFLNNGIGHQQEPFSLSKASLLSFSKIPILQSKNYKVEDTDPIRNWILRLVNEDTTYFRYKADIDVRYDTKNPIVGRTARWKFAWELFEHEYNWKQKLFGNGFDFLNWYGYYFYNDKTRSDWPHNPFLSVLLYSGIIGLGLYLFLMYKVIVIYLKYLKEYYILFIFFGITSFFSFFSAGNPFDPPVMGFFVMLPFLMDYVHKKDKSN